MDDIPKENLEGREIGDCYCAAYELPESNQSRVIALLDPVGNDNFWLFP